MTFVGLNREALLREHKSKGAAAPLNYSAAICSRSRRLASPSGLELTKAIVAVASPTLKRRSGGRNVLAELADLGGDQLRDADSLVLDEGLSSRQTSRRTFPSCQQPSFQQSFQAYR